MENKDFYLDEPCVVSLFTGELGWFIQRWQGYLRSLKLNEYKNHKFIMFMRTDWHCLVHDFATATIDLPEWFYALSLETDCYESPLPGSPPGSLTPPEVYAKLIEHMRKFYNREKAIELWPPRGYSTIIDGRPQTFVQYTSDEIPDFDRPYVVVYPRGRARAAQRNVPEFVWREVVDGLVEYFNVVLIGTPSGSCLVDYEREGVLNTIKYSGSDKLEKVVDYMTYADMSIGSQSGPTHISLVCKTPAYIIGHEKNRHIVTDNRFKIPASFRNVIDYRAIDSTTILDDISRFHKRLTAIGVVPRLRGFDKILDRDMASLIHIVQKRREDLKDE